MDGEKTVLANNEKLVRRVATYALALGRCIPTSHETRALLGFAPGKTK